MLQKIKQILLKPPALSPVHIGLDIAPTSVFLLELTGSSNKPTLQHMAAASIPSKAMSNDDLIEAGELAKSIARAKYDSTIIHTAAAICAPGALVITKEVPLSPHVKEEDLESYAWDQASRAFPGLADNLYLDFVVQHDKKSMQAKRTLLLVAARKQEMQSRLRAIEDGGLKTKVIDIDYYALERAYQLVKSQLPAGHEQQHVALLNINTATLLMSVIHDGQMVYGHRQAYQGTMLEHLVKKALSLDEATGSNDPLSGNMMGNDTGKLSASEADILTGQIERFLQYFSNENPNKKLQHIMLSGRCAMVPGIAELLEEKLHITTTLANPFKEMHLASSIDAATAQAHAPAYMVCCGLAMRRNL